MTSMPSVPSKQRPAVVIVGASVRALAASATRADWAVYAADLFGDVDLTALACESRRVANYPSSLADAAATCPSGPWCYTGALENHPELIDSIAAVRPLAGNSGTTVRRVREAAILGPALQAAGLRFPETHAAPAGLPTDGSFLVKPRASAGGRGIRRWTVAEAATHRDREPAAAARVWQRFVAGVPLAAAYVIQAGSAVLLGVSRQLVGEVWCNARPFAYCGSIALPIEQLPGITVDQLARIGTLLAGSFGLMGVVGADLVMDSAGHITLIEVNPRPTASLELIERAHGSSIAGLHLAACGYAPTSPQATFVATPAHWSKAILFAPRDLASDDRLIASLDQMSAAWSGSDGWPALADIPQPGQTIESGSPFITIFARGESADDSHARLLDRTQAVQHFSLSQSSSAQDFPSKK